MSAPKGRGGAVGDTEFKDYVPLRSGSSHLPFVQHFEVVELRWSVHERRQTPEKLLSLRSIRGFRRGLSRFELNDAEVIARPVFVGGHGPSKRFRSACCLGRLVPELSSKGRNFVHARRLVLDDLDESHGFLPVRSNLPTDIGDDSNITPQRLRGGRGVKKSAASSGGIGALQHSANDRGHGPPRRVRVARIREGAADHPERRAGVVQVEHEL
jgi:hypothetical protein